MIKRFAALGLSLLAFGVAHAQDGTVNNAVLRWPTQMSIQAPEGCGSGLYRTIREHTVECVDRIDSDLVKRFCALRTPGDDAQALACAAPEGGGK
jgi:hypothetical protein